MTDLYRQRWTNGTRAIIHEFRKHSRSARMWLVVALTVAGAVAGFYLFKPAPPSIDRLPADILSPQNAEKNVDLSNAVDIVQKQADKSAQKASQNAVLTLVLGERPVLVTVDNTPLGRKLNRVALPLAPGKHQVVLRAQKNVIKKTFQLKPGATYSAVPDFSKQTLHILSGDKTADSSVQKTATRNNKPNTKKIRRKKRRKRGKKRNKHLGRKKRKSRGKRRKKRR